MKKWVNEPINKKNVGREWCYDNKKHRIIVEKKLDGLDGDLPDYKFFCFDGKPICLYMMQNYRENHDLGELGFFDMNFKLLDVHRKDFKPILRQPEKPKNFEKMVEMAKKLSKGFPHVRVDFYNIDGNIFFGEMTFFNASGYFMFEPDEYDFELGNLFNI